MADDATPDRAPRLGDVAAGRPWDRAGRPWRSFAVETYAGRKIAGWPFGRFDIGPHGLRVRLGFPWFTTRSAAKDTITAVTLARTLTNSQCLRFGDSGGHMTDVHVHLPVRGQRVLDELLRCGYVVTERTSPRAAARLARPRPSPRSGTDD